jgi:glycosyltransferase involved in cell wall biosynthesis
MNICIFAKGLPLHVIGGLELHTHELTKGLIKKGHKVTIITTKHPKGIKQENKGNLKIFYVGDEPLRYNNKFCIESAKLFDKLDGQENFDIVQSIQGFGSGFAKYSKSNKPLVVSLHGTLKYEIRSILNERSMKMFYLIPYRYFKSFLFYYPMDRALFGRTDRIMVDSKELKRDVIREYKIPKEKIVLIYDGIDTKRFKPINVDKFRKKLGIFKDEKVILSSGRIEKTKGYHLIIEVLPNLLRHMNIKLIIVGTGKYLKNLKKLAERKKVSDNVIFTGLTSNEDMVKYYNLADVFVFPTFRVEAFGIVIAEAMSCGKPAIATRVGGIPSVIDDSENGFLIKMNNLKELTDKILLILSDEKMKERLGHAARKKVINNFSMEKMIADTIKLYGEVINESRRKIV